MVTKEPTAYSLQRTELYYVGQEHTTSAILPQHSTISAYLIHTTTRTYVRRPAMRRHSHDSPLAFVYKGHVSSRRRIACLFGAEPAEAARDEHLPSLYRLHSHRGPRVVEPARNLQQLARCPLERVVGTVAALQEDAGVRQGKVHRPRQRLKGAAGRVQRRAVQRRA